MIKEFKNGDVVLLNSGSPVMTIRNIYIETVGNKSYNVAYCEWFMNGLVQAYHFQLTSLKFYIAKNTIKLFD